MVDVGVFESFQSYELQPVSHARQNEKNIVKNLNEIFLQSDHLFE